MQYKLLILFLVLTTKIFFAQKIFIGGNGTIGIINKNSTSGLGISINVEYCYDYIPFSFRLSTKCYYSEFSNSQLYLATYDYILKTIELNILYIPIRKEFGPYLGFGLGYDFVNVELSGNVNIIHNLYVISNNPQNTFNYNFILGAHFLPEKTLSTFIELLYSVMELKYDIELEDEYSNRFFRNSTIILNRLSLNIGIRIRL